jgi:hypothetical protein
LCDAAADVQSVRVADVILTADLMKLQLRNSTKEQAAVMDQLSSVDRVAGEMRLLML